MNKIVNECPLCSSPIYAQEMVPNDSLPATCCWTCNCLPLIQERFRAETEQVKAQTQSIRDRTADEDWKDK